MTDDTDAWIALGTLGTFFATLTLAFIAYFQIKAARDENRKTQTLLACGNYDTDPIIFHCHRKLVIAKDYEFRNDAALLRAGKRLRLEVITILNFLDAIAIGVTQGLYIDDLAKAHISPIFRRHVEELIESGVAEKLDCKPTTFEHLIVVDRWWQQPKGDFYARPRLIFLRLLPQQKRFHFLLKRDRLR